MENKVIIINPLDEAYGLSDGKINFMGSKKSNLSHGDLLTRYGVQIYGEDSIFGILSNGNFLVDVPVYFLTEGNDIIVFLNVSNSKIGKVGLLYLPSNISDKQRESLGRLSELLKDYRVEVNYNLRVDDGIVDSDRHTIRGIDEVSCSTLNNQKKA